MKRALALALELEGLLGQSAREEATFVFRLARAHVLSAIDALADLVRDQAESRAAVAVPKWSLPQPLGGVQTVRGARRLVTPADLEQRTVAPMVRT